MSLFSSKIQVILIILPFLLSSESFFIRSPIYKYPMICSMYNYELRICTKEHLPVCGTNGRTYFNKCTFCIAYREHGGTFTLAHYGQC